jgi:hypothetical protein
MCPVRSTARETGVSFSKDRCVRTSFLSAWLLRFLEALGHEGPVMVAGHDIGVLPENREFFAKFNK